MRELSATLLAAQQAPAHTPYIEVKARNTVAGVVRLDWERLYTGSEDDYFHALTLPGDGSLVRVRITPPSDSRKLYRQRVAEPGPSSNFGQWDYTGQYNAVIVASCSLGAEVSVFWIKSDRKIYQLRSSDYGASWDNPQLLGYTPTTAINGIAAAYKANGDIALFFADQDTLYVMKRVSDSWGGSSAWDKSTGELSGVACVYDGDWRLFVTGQDDSGNYKLWSLAYGDGDEVPAGTWSALKEFASAPQDGNFEYHRSFLDKPDVHRGFFVEKYTGTEGYSRPFWSYTVVDTSFGDNLWHEPVPFDLSSEYGLAIGHHGNYCWLSAPHGVWRSGLAVQEIDLAGDVISLKEDVSPTEGRLTVELRNDDGRYAAPGQGELAALDNGCQISFSPGYRTAVGNEVSTGQVYSIESREHTSHGGHASLILHTMDGWGAVHNWRSRHQFRWNMDSDELNVKDIMAFVLARVGLKLEGSSASVVMTGFYPDFTIHPGDRGQTVIRRLLSFVPDVVLTAGDTAIVVNPQDTDSSVYSYGTDHPLTEGRYRTSAWRSNRVQVEGYDPAEEEVILAEVFAWPEVGKLYDRLYHVADRGLGSVAQAQERGQAHLREEEMAAGGGFILAPTNCGQQLYDVIDITDGRAGLDGEKRRVMGLTLVYQPRRGQYEHTIALGGV